MLPFDTAHTFCASRDGRRNADLFRTVPPKSKVISAVYDYAGKGDLSKCY